MKSGTFNMLRQLIEENISLVETGKRSGFLRDYYHFHPSAIKEQLSAPGTMGIAYFDSVARMDKLLKNCTAEEYACLTECTYTSSKEFVKMYIDTLTKLYDAGVFDINDPNYFAASPINPIPSPIPNEAQEDMKKFTIPEGAVLLGQPQPTLGDNSWAKKGNSEKYDLPEGAMPTNQESDPKQAKPDEADKIWEAFEKVMQSGRMFNKCTNGRELKSAVLNEEDKDNSGKPYHGNYCEISFKIENTDIRKKVADILHNTFTGMPDYINSNVILNMNDEDSEVILAICIDDLTEYSTVFARLFSTLAGLPIAAILMRNDVKKN